ncbi:MAG: hypothetical protein ACO23H_12095 [Alphaproteobacteria bacterium]
MLTKELHDTAVKEAKKAVENYLLTHGKNPTACGFAGVVARVDGRTRIAKSLRAQGFRKSTYGYKLWDPSNSITQDMFAKAAGAEAYIKTVESEVPVDFFVHTTWD